ncbi:MAG: response regulator transcription factor, partial [Deltaproteobacteria bacterium]|nr:response regulator transcription factor [Deltaproteobacteria bacterium]
MNDADSIRLLYVYGPHQMQNELMVELLASKTSLVCRLGDSEYHPSPTNDHQESLLALWDCSGLSREELLERLENYSPHDNSNCRMIFFNVAVALDIQRDALTCGLWGVFPEHCPLEQLVQGVEAIAAGQMWISRWAMSSCLQEFRQTSSGGATSLRNLLTLREQEVLQLIANGESNERIADHLFISGHTVKSHLYRIYKKIEV